jgi:hypothetical protein
MISGTVFGRGSRKGIAPLMLAGLIGILLIFAMLGFSFFSGGVYSSSIFGWGDIPILSGIESFLTGIYNLLVFIATWVTISVLGMVFIGLQAFFIFIYYKLAMFLYAHKNMVEEFLNKIAEL